MKRKNNVKEFRASEERPTDDQSVDVKLTLSLDSTVEESVAKKMANDCSETQEVGFAEYQSLLVGAKFITLSDDEFLDLLPANSYFH